MTSEGRTGAFADTDPFIWGKEESLLFPEFGPRLGNTAWGSQLLMIEGCGHLPPQAKAAKVSDAMRRFLQS